jgi:hypothetical protein
MHKLSDYVKMAADTYFEETGDIELSAHWIAEFFHDCGVQDAYPRQDLVNFARMVQKELTKNDELATKKMHFQLEKIIRAAKYPRNS